MTVLGFTQAVAETPDEAALKTIVESVAVLADRGSFEALETLFADEILVDYSSLSGIDAELKSPQALMNEWAATLPGFDRTRHALENVDARVDGATGSATASVVADHYVGDLHWQVSGRYRYAFVRDGREWRIAAMAFLLDDETGTRDVFGPAMEKAKQNPPDYVIRQTTIATVRALLESLENEDMQRFANLWADDAVQDMPFSPEGHPKRVAGKTDLIALYAAWPNTAANADFTSELVFHAMQDPEMVFAEFKGRVDIVPTGREYRQTYGGLFHVVDGRIQLFREYYDPAAFAWAFGLE